MEARQIVPDVIDTVPPNVLQIEYMNGLKVDNGNELTPTQVKNKPTNVKWEYKEDMFYTLVFVDPDALSRDKHFLREVLHWMIVNISKNDLESGQIIAEYRGSGPPKYSGLHRYVFLLYEQPSKITVEERFTFLTDRLKFSIRKFAKKYNLQEPVAGNFFQAQSDCKCIIL